MEKNNLNYWIDVGLLISFIFVAVTGLVLYFAFISNAPGAGRNVTFLGTYKVAWLPWHSFFGIVMVMFAFVHLVLHFGWMVGMTKKMFKGKNETAVDSGIVPRAIRKK
ncbi:MAG: DUF4405 domain-containing protein [Nanoarchaeota archaeon]|nr:DUF4405 domain-containing protein [Nanoarchaeota archaeon]